MTDLVYLHNPRCRKSREGLELLRDKGIEPQVREYLKNPLSASELKSLAELLDPDSLNIWVRKGEDAFKKNHKGKVLTLEEQIMAIAEEPKLLERPIFIHRGKAKVGRPPERLLELA